MQYGDKTACISLKELVVSTQRYLTQSRPFRGNLDVSVQLRFGHLKKTSLKAKNSKKLHIVQLILTSNI